MNAERLLQLYDRVSDAPDAIPRLRRFILDLSVRGKLVEQEPADEPALRLLRRINAERDRLIRSKTIKGGSVDPIGLNDIPFELPATWCWTRLGAIGDWGSGSTPSRGNAELYGGGITWLKSGELNDNTELAGSEETVTETTIEKGSFRINQPGDVLIAMYGATIGKLAILAETAVTNQAVCGCTPFAGVFNHFLFLFLLSQREALRRASEGGAQPNISKAKIVNTLFPLAPLAEQHRIVVKFDELMALCDSLEAERKKREATRDRLTTASLSCLTAPGVDEKQFKAHADFAIKVLPELTSRPDQIKVLRQTILDLAVRGKLVKQDPKDAVATDALNLIARDKADREVRRQTERSRRPKVPRPETPPYSVPTTWSWAAFGDLVISRDGERIPVSREARSRREKVYDYYGASGVIDKIDGYLFDQPLLLIGEDGANLINRSTPIAFIARGKYWVNNHAHVLDGLSEQFLRYLELFINATDLKPYVTGTAQPKMNQAKMNSIPIAVPPFAEQRRIIERVDELTALCDSLEHGLINGDDARRHLSEALLLSTLGPVLREVA